MNVGIRLGAPVEPAIWTVDRIARTYGDIHAYVKEYKHFAADDDANGPVFFLRALDDTNGSEPSPGSVAEAYLNYAREGIGMFWWGGYGISTEHTAYLNLLSGIPAPESGSIAQNGSTVAEQIGGQIFIDTWGLVAPGDPERAARYAKTAASVSHDGEALNGAAFIAACISAAFTETDIDRIIDRALLQVPSFSKYAQVVQNVRKFYIDHPEDDWHACREMLEQNWGYDKFAGACHVIPNAGVCALALVYGRGDFCRTIEIATMCGWDTDCNAGNVGTIVGVLNGVSAIPEHYRRPINDELVFSSVSGYLNIQDIPTYIWHLACWVYRLRNEEIPAEIYKHIHPGVIDFDFSLPGSTHGLRLSDPYLMRLQHKDNALEIMWNQLERGQQGKIFLKTFYRRDDFSDERYKPAFSPIAYSGQEVLINLTYEKWKGESIVVTPYIMTAINKQTVLLEPQILREDGDYSFSFVLPDTQGDLISEVGIHIEGNSPRITYDAGRVLIHSFKIFGKADYTIHLDLMPKEFETNLPFTQNHGAWSIEEGRMNVLTLGHAEATTGNYFMQNVSVSSSICPQNGPSHLLAVRVQGTRRGYYAGLGANNTAVILKHAGYELTTLATVPFEWKNGQEYDARVIAFGHHIQLWISDELICEATDDDFSWGMVGYALYATGRTIFGDLIIKEI